MSNTSQNDAGNDVTGNDNHDRERNGDRTTILDVSGLQCPLPVLKTQKALRGLESGQILQVISTDPMATIDIPHFCKEHGHRLLRQEPQGDATIYVLEKGQGPANLKR